MNIGKPFGAIILLLFSFLFPYRALSSSWPVAVNGVLDLRQQTFPDKIPLNGQWLFYWHRFVSPKDTVKGNGIIVNFPFKWNGYVLNGKELPSFGYATFRLTVLLPKTHYTLRLSMPDTYCAYRLYINGDLATYNGQISDSPKGFVPY